MSVKKFNIGWFVLIFHHLSDWVLIELGCSSAKSILFVLIVIGLEMVNESWGHVCMILARPYTGIKLSSDPSHDSA